MIYVAQTWSLPHLIFLFLRLKTLPLMRKVEGMGGEIYFIWVAGERYFGSLENMKNIEKKGKRSWRWTEIRMGASISRKHKHYWVCGFDIWGLHFLDLDFVSLYQGYSLILCNRPHWSLEREWGGWVGSAQIMVLADLDVHQTVGCHHFNHHKSPRGVPWVFSSVFIQIHLFSASL